MNYFNKNKEDLERKYNAIVKHFYKEKDYSDRKSETSNSEIKRKSENAIDDRTAYLTAITENTTANIWSVDTDYKIIYVNNVFVKAYKEAFGVELSVGIDILEALPAPLRKSWKERYDRALANEQFIVSEIVDAPSGNIHIEVSLTPIVLDGKVVGVSLFGNDVTRQGEIDRAIRESEANLKAIIENSLESIWSIDQKYNIQYVNEVFASSFEKSFGVRLLPGANIYESLPEPLKEIWKARYDRVLSGEHFVFTDRIDLEADSIYIEVAMNPIIVDGDVVGASFYGKDISESKRTEHQLIAAKEKAEESDRLKSAFLANMSHEIRTPMNGILGFTELLKEPKFSGDEKEEFINIIEKSGERLLNIINDLVFISKLDSGQITVNISDTNICEQLDFLYNFFEPEATKKGLQLSVIHSEGNDKYIVKTDQEKVYAILTNLIKNAIKFTQDGSITVDYTFLEGKPTFCVSDTGIGIPDCKKESIFERFSQAESSIASGYDGAGLGLSICKAYVEMLGGEIWVEPNGEKGSKFYFSITPADSYQIIAGPNERKDDTPISQDKRLSILIAEDDETSIVYYSKILDKNNYELLFARNGVEAVEMCRNNKNIDFVLMDIHMPEMDGVKATNIIRGFSPTLPIIAQTAYALDVDREKYKSIFEDYITKPVSKDQLERIILSFQDYRASFLNN